MNFESSAPFFIVSDPDDRRFILFQEARKRAGISPGICLNYDAIDGWAAELAKTGCGVVRVESPGRGFRIYRKMLLLGASAAAAEGGAHIGPDAVADLVERKGEILYLRQWYLGFCRALEKIKEVAEQGDFMFTSDPDDIAVMFDKRACHRRLLKAGIRVPPALGPAESFDELIDETAKAGWSRVFVKPAHGSSASGVVALERSRGRIQAATSAEIVVEDGKTRIFNSRRMSRYRNIDQLRPLIDELCRHKVHVERWVPKAGVDGKTCDLRVLAVNGEPRHMVLRKSRSPITNLHLLNERDSAERLREKMSKSSWHALLETCRKTARVFPKTMAMGLDIAVAAALRNHYVLEVNAFGDLLNGVLWQGMTPYELELSEMFDPQRHEKCTASSFSISTTR